MDLKYHPHLLPQAAIDTYEDHRMAMAFSLVGLKASGIRIKDPECVSKTFPNYFEVLREPLFLMDISSCRSDFLAKIGKLKTNASISALGKISN